MPINRREFLFGAGVLALNAMVREVKSDEQHESQEYSDLEKKSQETIHSASVLLATTIDAFLKRDNINNLNLDHALLALGNNPVIEDKTLLQLGAGPSVNTGVDKKTQFFSWQQAHAGAISYALLRSNVPLTEKIQVSDGSNMTVEQWIQLDMQRIFKEGELRHDYEWTLLIAVELKKRGMDISQFNDHMPSLKKLRQLNTQELDYEYHPEHLKKPELDDFKSYASRPTCDATHALHALVADAVNTDNRGEASKLVSFTCDQMKSLLQKNVMAVDQSPEHLSQQYQKLDHMYKTEEVLHKLSHFITVLSELDPTYHVTRQQKTVLRQAIVVLNRAMQEYTKCWNSLAQDEIHSPNIGTLAHVIDALQHFPLALTK